MKNRKETSRVSIDIYDAYGELCETVGGTYDYEDIKEQMIDILRNDGIPVIRRAAKHAAQEDAPAPVRCTVSDKLVPISTPVSVSIEFEDVSFEACGQLADVLEVQDLFLENVLAE